MTEFKTRLGPEDAAAEMLRRKRSRESLVGFAQNIQIPGAPAASSDRKHAWEEQPDDDFDALTLDDHLLQPIGLGVSSLHVFLMNKIQHTMETPYAKLMIFMPPGAAKSTYGSVIAPTWKMGKVANTQIILGSYNTALAKKHGSRGRNIVAQDIYLSAFNTTITPTSQAKEFWTLTNGSEYMSGGLQSGLTGNRADGLIIDDPVRGRADAKSENIQTKTIDAYEDDAQTRLKPGAWQILIQCMVGSTQVLMADGTEKNLSDISPGDDVASYSHGKIVSAKVVNWANRGSDRTHTIRTTSGIFVTANERHPFLVKRNGKLEWVRLHNLKVGDALSKVVVSHTKQKDFATTTTKRCDTRKTSSRSHKNLAIGESIGASPVHGMVAQSRQGLEDSVWPTTQKTVGQVDTGRHQSIQKTNESDICDTDMASTWPTMKPCLQSKMEDALSANNYPEKTYEVTGKDDCALTTVTEQERSEDCFATTATLPLVTEKQKKSCLRRLSTYTITTDEISEIVLAGIEDVFDIEVAETENFIANGLVSHNTRWDVADLAGMILPDDYGGESGLIQCRDGMDWEIINLPAKAKYADDPLGRKVGEYLWPEWFDAKHWYQYEPRPGDPKSPNQRRWDSLFQQEPRPDSGNQWDEGFTQWYQPGTEPKYLVKFFASDYAVTDVRDSDDPDFTEHGIAGLDEHGHLWLVDWYYSQHTTNHTIKALIDLCKVHNVRMGFGEQGIIRRAIESQFETQQREAGYYLSATYLPHIGDKIAKFSEARAMGSAGKVHVPDTPWGRRLHKQLTVFPSTASKDDGVDVLSLFARAAKDMVWSRDLVTPEKKKGIVFGSWEWLTHNEAPAAPQSRWK